MHLRTIREMAALLGLASVERHEEQVRVDM
jgi:hypothetical protein